MEVEILIHPENCMTGIVWCDDLMVGIADMDSQHGQLIGLVNSFADAYAAGAEQEALEPLVNELCEYARSHFEMEERLMATHGYPNMPRHVEEHREFTFKALDFLADCMVERLTVSAEVLDYLVDWLIRHVGGTDKNLAAFLRANGCA